MCAFLIGCRSDCKSSGGRRGVASRRAMSFFGRIRIWSRSGNYGFVACESHTNDFFLDGNKDCEGNVEQGDSVFLQAVSVACWTTLVALQARLALPHAIRAKLYGPDTYEARRHRLKLDFSSSVREGPQQFRSLTH